MPVEYLHRAAALRTQVRLDPRAQGAFFSHRPAFPVPDTIGPWAQELMRLPRGYPTATFRPTAFQGELFTTPGPWRSFHPRRYQGASTGLMVLACYLSFMHPRNQTMILLPNAQLRDLFKEGLDAMIQDSPGLSPELAHQGGRTQPIRWENGSRIDLLPVSRLRSGFCGRSVDTLLVDLARMMPATGWEVLFPALYRWPAEGWLIY